MYNFGSPRVGNKKFSDFVSSYWPTDNWRITHNKDIVPHNPSSGILMEYWQTCTERWEDKNHVMQMCPNGCEDNNCAAGVDVLFLSIDDHLLYMGMCMGSNCPNCKVAAAPLEDTTFL
jgi:hypothetical protein